MRSSLREIIDHFSWNYLMNLPPSELVALLAISFVIFVIAYWALAMIAALLDK